MHCLNLRTLESGYQGQRSTALKWATILIILQLAPVQVRLVSMVCWELFEAQPESYRNEVLPLDCQARVSVEAGSKLGWREWVGPRGKIIAVDHFGASADYDTLFAKFGFSVDNIVKVSKQAIAEAVPV